MTSSFRTHLFSPLSFSGLELKNRIAVSPMCQYSSTDGLPNEWHLVHLGSRATGGAALVMTEATAVSPDGRISPGDTGLWNEAQGGAWKKIVQFIHSQGAAAGIQLAHAGRKASAGRPWDSQRFFLPGAGGWEPVAPSAVAFDKQSPLPRALSTEDMERVCESFENSARRALEAGFDVVEIHAAHGYLLHEFLSPLSNFRKDAYGGSLENRMRLLLQICSRVKRMLPQGRALFVRISATDWFDGGWDLEQSIILGEKLREVGVDLIDVSSGGLVPQAKIPVGPLYQVNFAEQIRKWSKIKTGAVGLIQKAQEAEEILKRQSSDLVFIGRAMLRDAYWPLRAAESLGENLPCPAPYQRGWS